MSQEEVNLMAFVQDVRRELRDIPELKTLSVLDLQKEVFESASATASPQACARLGAIVSLIYVKMTRGG